MAVLPPPWCFRHPMEDGISSGFSLRLTGSSRQIWFEHVEPGASWSRREWIRTASIHNSCPREQSVCLVLFVAHSHSVSLSQRHIQRCLSVSEKIMLIKEPSSSNTVIVRWWEGGQLTRSLVFFVVLFACFVVAVLSVHSRLPLSRLLFFSPPCSSTYCTTFYCLESNTWS